MLESHRDTRGAPLLWGGRQGGGWRGSVDSRREQAVGVSSVQKAGEVGPRGRQGIRAQALQENEDLTEVRREGTASVSAYPAPSASRVPRDSSPLPAGLW